MRPIGDSHFDRTKLVRRRTDAVEARKAGGPNTKLTESISPFSVACTRLQSSKQSEKAWPQDNPNSSKHNEVSGGTPVAAVAVAALDTHQIAVVTPTVDGHPDVCEVLAGGQLFSRQLLSFMRDLGTMEIHGYKPDFGYRVYTEKAIEMTDQPDVPTANGHRPLAPQPPASAPT
jgi:hypothetical protein